jgi:hypothetical protein
MATDPKIEPWMRKAAERYLQRVWDEDLSLVDNKPLAEEIARAYAEQAPKWIPVEERLPSVGLEVLTQVADSPNKRLCGCWLEVNFVDEKGQSFERGSHGPENIAHSGNQVTHWMPLPEAPHE